MKKILAIIEISRPLNLLITFAVIVVSAVICSEGFKFTATILFGAISAMLVAASGNIINDYYDYKIDKINKPYRPIPSGRINRKESLIIYIQFIITSIIISSLVSIAALLLVIVTIALLFFYSLYFKRIPLIGNLAVSVSTGLAFIFGGIIVGNINAAIIPAGFAFLINLIREVVKDIEDMDGDKKNEIHTFPIIYGLKSTKTFLTFLSIILFISTLIPFVFSIYKIEYYLIILFGVNLPLIYFLREVYSKLFLKKLSKLSLMLKIVMMFGLLAIFLG